MSFVFLPVVAAIVICVLVNLGWSVGRRTSSSLHLVRVYNPCCGWRGEVKWLDPIDSAVVGGGGLSHGIVFCRKTIPKS